MRYEHINAPAFILDDRNGRAMCAAIDAMFTYIIPRVRAGVEQVVDIDRMEEWRLDELAWEYALPWYNWGADVEQKRRTIKTIYDTIRVMGTPRAVSAVVSSFLGSRARLAEWFEYGGAPYHFRVVSSGEIPPARERAQIIAALDAARNVRSFLDGIVWALPGDARGYVAAGAQLAIKCEGRAVM